MTDQSNSVTTPASAASSTQAGSSHHLPKIAAPKDRACPYCHVNFTSSSLGRHLDLYIKEKNPKPADGIHNVDEIRKSRAGITRRQAKSSKRHGHYDRSQDLRQDDSLVGSASPSESQVDRRMGPYAFRNLFNTPHWTSTGVITDSDANRQLMNGDVQMSGTPSANLDPVTRHKWAEERERGRAAELALTELIDSIKAASSQAKLPEVYEFDFFSCSFPELCLRILSPPAALDRPTFISDDMSWSVDPPDETAYKALQRRVYDHVVTWRTTYLPPTNPRKRRRSASPGRYDAEDTMEPNPVYQGHLTTAWNAYASQPLMKKAPEYHMWALRLYAQEKDEHAEAKRRLEYLETELSRAKIDNARLTECQMPREWLHTPASQLPLAKLAADKVERELKNGLDVEKLIAKWQPRVQAARTMGRQHETEEARQARLAMLGTVGTPNRQQQPPQQLQQQQVHQQQMNMNAMNHDGRMQDDEDEDEDAEDDEEEEYDEDDDGEEEYDEANEQVMGRANGTIAPSLRNQLGAMASS